MGADLIRRPLARHTSGQRTQGFLAHIIFQRADMRVDAIQRTNADYPPPIPGSHVRKHSFHCPESGPEIHGTAVLHLSIRLVLRATETTPAPCIVDEDVNAAEPLYRLINHAEPFRAHPNIGRYEIGRAWRRERGCQYV